MKEQKITNLLKKNETMTTTQIATELGIHYYDALMTLKEMEEKRILNMSLFSTSEKRKIRGWSLNKNKSEMHGRNKSKSKGSDVKGSVKK